jgi:LacI family transcriptional regulator
MENAIFARGVQAMEETLAAAGVTLLIATSAYDPAREARQIAALLGRGVDGLILIGESRPNATYDLLLARAAPYVLAWTIKGEAMHPCVGFDNRAASAAMTRHVLAIGHREIAMIAGLTQWNDRAAERVAGVRDALAEAGVSAPASRFVEAAYDLEAGAKAFDDLLHTDPEITAVLCGNDVLAAGALIAARRRGVAVPDHVSVVGFDNIDLAEVVVPGLTTVHVPHRRMGAAAAEALLQLREGRSPGVLPRLETHIVERASLGPPRF